MKTPLQSRPVLVHPGDGERVNVIGDEQTIKLNATQTGGAFAMIEQIYRPGGGVPLHFHTQEDAVFYIVEGHMDFVVGGKAISAHAGSTVLLPRAVAHSSKAGPEGAKALVVLFPGGGENMFRELHALSGEEPDSKQVKGVCKRYGVHFV
ncbi:MAG TPA: cupin domain-containing protein [Terriglobales bacterium]|nr:cupin domain-containing protein [Terriglobales bacterium]